MAAAPSSGPMTPAAFIAKWRRTDLPERAASQEHFIDLCRLLGQPTPAEHDATGAEYTFEKGVAVTGPASRGAKGQGGFADVWWRGKFAWEYKRKEKYRDLDDAYRQLCQYREALENPLLLVVSDIARTEIHTNFTGTAKEVHTVPLEEFDDPAKLALVRRVFTDPESFRPALSAESVTEEVARQIGTLAQRLHGRGHDPHAAAHFLMKCMFSLFAEDVGLLPNDLFSRLLGEWHDQPADLCDRMTGLFASMRDGGAFGFERIPHFNGGLFDEAAALKLDHPEIGILMTASRQDWASVEPAIFGTLFERSLDPDKRSQIGAHYTSREDIMLVVEPVVMAPLRKEWEAVQEQIDKQIARRAKARTDATKRKANRQIEKLLREFVDRLASVRILDPACGSGNFLYVAIQQLLGLEKAVITRAAQPDVEVGLLPHVRPTQLHGIEINPYAAELAQVVIWIGYLQWMQANGFSPPRDPILEPIETIECRDAILAWADEDGNPLPEWRPGAACTGPAEWPEADFIIGNPPFLGSKLFRKFGLDDAYLEALYETFDLPNTSDLCCYWFELARQAIQRAAEAPPSPPAGEGRGEGAGVHPHPSPLPSREREQRPALRAGLLATQGIRGGANRRVLERIKETGDIFMAWSDRPWVLDGAAVHVSIVGFDDGSETEPTLDGKPVKEIHANLSGDIDTAAARHLAENEGIYRRPPEKGAKFEMPAEDARRLLVLPNPHGRSNFDVLHPWINGKALAGRDPGKWILDFPTDMEEAEAAQYEGPFEWARRRVKKARAKNRDPRLRQYWWVFRRSGDGVRQAANKMPRLLCTTMVSKHRLFTWVDAAVQPDKTITVFARSDDYFLGVLQSSVHTLWALRMGTQLETRPRYTPTTCFETFPLPWPPGEEPEDDPLYQRISEAAHALDEQRERWLNPPEWIDPIADTVDRTEDFSGVPEEARPLVRDSLIMAQAAKDKRLKARTLTNLYNERPTWLRLAHAELDRAVLAAYAATDPEGEWSEEWAEVWADSGAGRPLPDDHPMAARRAEVDERVLADLLRLNLARS
jgi:hypothetical protein